jgi:outer membrane protein TolC
MKRAARIVLITLVAWDALVFPKRLFPEPLQDPASRLSLSEAIQAALTHHPKITVRDSRQRAAKENIIQAESGFFPRLSWEGSYSRTTNPMWAFGTKLNQGTIAPDDFDPDRLNDPSAIDNFSSRVTARWSLFDSGQTWYGWQQAKTAQQAEHFMTLRTRQEVMAEVVWAFAGLLQ